MDVNSFAFFSFVFITSFTPGPNNISSASMGIRHGYRGSLKYMAGIVLGFFLMMVLSATTAITLLKTFPSLAAIMRFVGAGYILWLAFHSLRTSYSFQAKEQAPLGFTNGLLLQLLNPKVIVYGLAVYSAFLASIAGRSSYLILSAIFLAAVGFCAVSTWALFGAAIRRYLHRPRLRAVVNIGLSLMLVYTAVELLGFGLSGA